VSWIKVATEHNICAANGEMVDRVLDLLEASNGKNKGAEKYKIIV
jgi:hypothetical protein